MTTPQSAEDDLKRLAGQLFALIDDEAKALTILRQQTQRTIAELKGIKDQLKHEISADLAKHLLSHIKGMEHHVTTSTQNTLKNAITASLASNLSQPTTQLQKAAQNASTASETLLKYAEQAESVSTLTLSSFLKTLCYGILPFVTVVGFLIGFYRWTLPSSSEIDTMRATIAQLKAQGGSAEVATCDGSPCVRVDLKKGHFGKKGDYVVLR